MTPSELCEVIMTHAAEHGLDCAVELQSNGTVHAQFHEGSIAFQSRADGTWAIGTLRGAVVPLRARAFVILVRIGIARAK